MCEQICADWLLSALFEFWKIFGLLVDVVEVCGREGRASHCI